MGCIAGARCGAAARPTLVIHGREARLSQHASVRKRPKWLRALGDSDPPALVSVGGREYGLDLAVKHDSWAATAIYADAAGQRITCKFNRQSAFFIVPLAWVGRWLARREAGYLRRFASIDLIPDDRGPVSVDGRVLNYAVGRVFIEGEAFRAGSVVDAAFFEDLRRTLDAVHALGVAYVDLHKRENIIIGNDGRPYLIDFQVSFGSPERDGPVRRWFVRQLQEMDDYHYRKHYARCLPHLLTAEQLAIYTRPPALVRAHRKVGVPLRSLRRWLLSRLKVRDRSGIATSELEPEAAFLENDPTKRPAKENGQSESPAR